MTYARWSPWTRRICVLVLALWCLVAGVAAAQVVQPVEVPQRLNYQGLMYLENGSNDVTGNFDMEFRLYPQAFTGNPPVDPIWGEAHAQVPVRRGQFSVVLGSGSAISGIPYGALGDLFRRPSVYIQVTIDGTPIRLRQQFVAAPHAFRAQEALTAIHGVPAGTVMPFAGATVPTGWILCDGRSLSRTDYPNLFGALGTLWGSTDSATFRVPDLRGRTPVGAGVGVDANTEGRSPAGITNLGPGIGSYRGTEQHTLTVSELPAHTHSYNDRVPYDKGGDDIALYDAAGTNNDHVIDEDSIGSSNRTTNNAGSGAAHNNMQASKVVNFIIKY